MNRIVLIGNGFDLAHGLKTSYKNLFWGVRIESQSGSPTQPPQKGGEKIPHAPRS